MPYSTGAESVGLRLVRGTALPSRRVSSSSTNHHHTHQCPSTWILRPRLSLPPLLFRRLLLLSSAVPARCSQTISRLERRITVMSPPTELRPAMHSSKCKHQLWPCLFQSLQAETGWKIDRRKRYTTVRSNHTGSGLFRGRTASSLRPIILTRTATGIESAVID